MTDKEQKLIKSIDNSCSLLNNEGCCFMIHFHDDIALYKCTYYRTLKVHAIMES